MTLCGARPQEMPPASWHRHNTANKYRARFKEETVDSCTTRTLLRFHYCKEYTPYAHCWECAITGLHFNRNVKKSSQKQKKKLRKFLSNSLSVFLFVIGANFSEARARRKEGWGECGRDSAFFFEKIGGDKRKGIHIWDYTSILRHGAIVDKVII
ncbi:hypothetical protein L0Y69_02525 [bacterium]|nr:hypothetical protein [bacterium]